MDFDMQLRQMAQNEAVPLPEDYSRRLEQLYMTLLEQEKEERAMKARWLPRLLATAAVIALMAVSATVGALAFGQRGETIGKAEALQLLEAYLVSEGIMGPGLSAREDDTYCYWDLPMQKRDINGNAVYSADILYGPGPMEGRLFGSYAVSIDGSDFYFYDQAYPGWVFLGPDKVVMEG